MATNEQCECFICSTSRRIDAAIESKDLDKLAAEAEGVLNAYVEAAEMASMHKMVLDGYCSCPEGVKMLEHSLAMTKTRMNEEMNHD